MAKLIHNLLKRQIKSFFGGIENVPDDFKSFIDIINDSYLQFDDDRYMLERSLDLSSDELLQANSEMRAIFQAFPDLFFRLDPQGKILDVKAGSTKDLAIQQNKLLGKRIQDVSEKIVQAKYIDAIKKVQDTKSIVSVEYMMKIDGDEFFYEARLMPILDNQIFVIIRNITGKKKVEIALRENEENYRNVLEASPDPIVVYDTDGNCKFINPSFTNVFGWGKDELLDKRIGVPVDNWPETRIMINKVMKGEGFSGFETRRCTKEGAIVDVSVSAAILHDTKQKPVGSVITLRDITDRKIMENKLLQAHKLEAIGGLAGGVAHDFNNLLTGMQGNISLILFEMDPKHPFSENIKSIEHYIKHGAELTKQLLGFASDGQYEIKTVNINKLIDKSLTMFARTRKEINIHLELNKKIWNVDVDRGQIEQVLLNLFVNSSRAMPGGGDLIIKTDNIILPDEIVDLNEHNNYTEFVRVSIKDTGIGIDNKIQNKIFDPFFTTKKDGRGTGLGLAIVYRIINNHNGIIKVRSVKGEGADFYIYLPSSKKEVVTPIKKSKKIYRGSETILIIDDEQMIINVAKEMLKKFGYTVEMALNGNDAIDIYREKLNDINLIILDMIMPFMSGKDTFIELKKINPRVKVLLSSGYSLDDQASLLLELGCNGFIQKPYDIIDLSHKIREILDK